MRYFSFDLQKTNDLDLFDWLRAMFGFQVPFLKQRLFCLTVNCYVKLELDMV